MAITSKSRSTGAKSTNKKRGGKTKSKKRGRTKDRRVPVFKKRVKRLLTTILATKKDRDKPLDIYDVAHALGESSDIEKAKTLYAWRRGANVPDSVEAWHLGETLRTIENGIPWSSGLLFLWICGCYDDYVATLAFMTRILGAHAADIGFILERLTPAAMRLSQPRTLDSNFDLREIFVTTDGKDPRTAQILKKARVSPFEQAEYLQREHAKGPWVAFADLADDANAAFAKRQPPGKRIKTRGRSTRQKKPMAKPYRVQTSLDRFPAAAIEIGASTQHSVVTIETALLAIVTRWMTFLPMTAQPNIEMFPFG